MKGKQYSGKTNQNKNAHHTEINPHWGLGLHVRLYKLPKRLLCSLDPRQESESAGGDESDGLEDPSTPVILNFCTSAHGLGKGHWFAK